MRTTLTISGIAVASALLLGACSSSHDSMPGMGSSSPAPATAAHNGDDISFAQQMIPHHSRAIDMAKLVPSHSTNSMVIDLAKRTEKAQDPEIQQMQSWLTSWGATSTSAMPDMSASSMPTQSGSMEHSMPGMMSEAEMQGLGQAKCAEFDKMWLDMMIKHHKGAVDMAQTEVANGGNTGAKALAQKIIDTQQTEITEMQGVLSQH
jgi:uncharacterized protein (DUF305 family)